MITSLMYPKPVLETRCLAYHREKQPPAGLSLVQHVIPGKPWASVWLTSVVSGATHPLVAGGPLLSEGLISSLFEWIEDGAFWPDNPYGSCNPKGLWCAKRGYWNAKLRLFQIKRGAGRRAFLPETTLRYG